MTEYVLALDQGTTSSRAILFDASGAPVSTAQREFDQLFPRPGWVEHRPEDLWASQVGVAAEALSRAGVAPNRVAALGITNQRETTLVWEKATGRPLGNAIVWQDRRTAGFCDELKARGLEPLFRERTGLVLDAYFSGTKVRWILDNVDGARAAAERGQLAFGTVDTWLIWHLTGGKVHATDASNAARTLMYDIRTGDWDDELLAALDIPRSMLPEVRDSSGDFGETAPGLLSAAVPVRGVAGDQQAALFGQACTRPGMVKNTYGTGCFMLLNTGAVPVPSSNQLLTTVAWRLKGKTTYALEGSVFIAGAVVQWLRDGLGLIRSAAEVEALAASVPDNGGVYLVPAFAGLGAPHWDPYARGVLAGITRGVTAGHLARAALEGVAFQVADVIEAMAADTGAPVAELRVDGGACANNLLMQFQADVLGAPLTRPRVIETTALGAAYLAGLGAGFWDGPDDISGQWREDRRFLPQTDDAGRTAMKQGWKKALERAKGWANA
jgi:glycerol kinase